MAKKIFLICPVRKAGDEVNERIAKHVAEGEARGDVYHWPKRDTKQDGDPIGIRICRDNRAAMFAADEVHVWYDPESKGSCFDLGMAMVFEESRKKVRIVNVAQVADAPMSIPLAVLIGLAVQHVNPLIGKLLAERSLAVPIESMLGHMPWVAPNTLRLTATPDDPAVLVMMGIMFARMRNRPTRLVLGVPIEPTEGKSFNNLLLWLVEETKNGAKTV